LEIYRGGDSEIALGSGVHVKRDKGYPTSKTLAWADTTRQEMMQALVPTRACRRAADS
jgi:hypothetical protein